MKRFVNSSTARVCYRFARIPIILSFLCILLLSAVPAATALVPPLTTPIAAFTYEFVHVAGPGGEPTRTIIVDASASSDPDGIRSYNLSWGDGTQETSSAPLIMHTYSSGGQYQVTLTVTDTTGQSASISKMVMVPSTQGTIPQAAFAYEFVHIAGPGGEPTWTIIVDASASSDPDGIRSYNLSWGDGTQETSSAPLIMHTYSSAGLYQVTLTVTDTTGQSGSISKMVPVASVKTVPTTPGTPIPTVTPLEPILPVLALIAGAVILFRR